MTFLQIDDEAVLYGDPTFDPHTDYTPDERAEYDAWCEEQDAWLEAYRPRDEWDRDQVVQLEAGDLMPDGDEMPF